MITEEAIDAADRWLGTIVCSFFPGMLILDYIFRKGLFTTPPSTIYEFILYIIHCAAISFIYVYVSQAAMEENLGSSFTGKAKSDQIGLVTAPLVIILSVFTIGAYIAIDTIASYDIVPIRSDHAFLVNTILSFLVMLGISGHCGRYYFRWYKETFHRDPTV